MRMEVSRMKMMPKSYNCVVLARRRQEKASRSGKSLITKPPRQSKQLSLRQTMKRKRRSYQRTKRRNY